MSNTALILSLFGTVIDRMSDSFPDVFVPCAAHLVEIGICLHQNIPAAEPVIFNALAHWLIYFSEQKFRDR